MGNWWFKTHTANAQFLGDGIAAFQGLSSDSSKEAFLRKVQETFNKCRAEKFTVYPPLIRKTTEEMLLEIMEKRAECTDNAHSLETSISLVCSVIAISISIAALWISNN